MQTDDKSDQSVLITGANGGIGLVTTKLLSGRGIHVFAGYRGADTVNSFEGLNNVTPVKIDVTSVDSIREALNTITQSGRTLKGIVNNTGLSDYGPLLEMTTESLERLINVNLYGVHRVTSVFIDLLIASQGRIINISSIDGILTQRFTGAYSMSKHALETYSDVLRLELEKFGIKVCVIEPGSFNSSMFKNNIPWIESRLEQIKDSRYAQETSFVLENSEQIIARQNALPDPSVVGEAIFKALSSSTPKNRYLVATADETERVVKHLLKLLSEINEDHDTALSKERLQALVDKILI